MSGRQEWRRRRRCWPPCAVVAVFLCGCQFAWASGLRPLLRAHHLHRVALRSMSQVATSQENAEALRALGLDPSLSPDAAQIKRAFRKMVARLHPDLQGGDADSQEFRDVLNAYAVLTGRRRVSKASSPSRPGTVWTRPAPDFAAQREAEFSRPENWRWNQGGGYNPSDLNEVWDEIGYNPYTGEYREAADRGTEETWVEQPRWATSRPDPSPPPQPARPRRAGLQEEETPLFPFADLLPYLALIAVSIYFALVPEQLPWISEEERAQRLEEVARLEEIKAKQLEQRRFDDMFWRQQQEQWQREQLYGLDESAPPED
mmetsp:Transcript_44238/g.103278  ORF Transcript_44238/g.103278 Transcript_44238/m.103278 type:complete len:317 (-) Transcript_44238:236-1186(-)